MKKIIAMLIAVVMVIGLVGCKKTDNSVTTPTAAPTEAVQNTNSGSETTPEPTATPVPEVKGDDVMSYAEYIAADIDTQVVVETYVQAKQSWWDNKATVYTQDSDGAYFLYNMACSEEDYAKLVPGTKIKVTGYKSEWAGEVEIVDATFEIEEGSYIAEAFDATELFANLDVAGLEAHQNEFFSLKGVTVEAQNDGSNFLYNWDGSGSHDSNSDLYFYVTVGQGTTYSFTVESYLCNNTTDVYAAVENLQVGDVVDIEGYLYWYEGVNPHTTSITVVSHEKSEGTMTYAEYAAAEVDTPVVVETYVMAKQSWWDNKATVYTQDRDGAYFLYNMACSEVDYEKLVPGTKIKVTGYKSEWAGEVEIVDATFEILPGVYTPNQLDVTDLLGTDELIAHQNEYVVFSDLTVVAQADGSAFLYSWDGSGSHDSNSDLYFTVESNGQTYNFTVESYLCNNTTDVYAAVENLQVGDVIDAVGYLYWYEGVNPHITYIVVK